KLICLYITGTLAPSFLFQSHTSWITACKWHARSWFHLLSASHDGKLMLWDLRTAWPLAKIESHEDKVLAADWWNGDSVYSWPFRRRKTISLLFRDGVGGAAVGGLATGGVAVGGLATGGVTVGGMANGGVVVGGLVTGAIGVGGLATGGGGTEE
ncbi:ribosome biogenesis protein WDR12, partial [Tanacetum coccineum]